MVILFIDDQTMEELLSLQMEYNSIIDGSFLITPIYPNDIMLTSMSKSAQLSVLLNIFSNMFSKVEIVQLLSYKVKSMKFRILLTHVIYLHPKQSGIFLVSNCIIDLQQSNVYKFTFSMSRPSHSTTIQISLHSYKMSVLTRPP